MFERDGGTPKEPARIDELPFQIRVDFPKVSLRGQDEAQALTGALEGDAGVRKVAQFLLWATLPL